MHITENTYIDRMFFYETTEAPLWNVQAVVFREGDGPWRAEMRLRIILDNKIGEESEDRKSFYLLHATVGDPDPRSTLAGTCRSTIQYFCSKVEDTFEPARLVELDVQGGRDAFLELLEKQPWCHRETVSAEGGEHHA